MLLLSQTLREPLVLVALAVLCFLSVFHQKARFSEKSVCRWRHNDFDNRSVLLWVYSLFVPASYIWYDWFNDE